jgi:hypothetical protein
MIDRDRRDDAGQRPPDHIGRVDPAAEPDLEQDNVGGMFGEQQKRRRRRDLEKGDGRAGVGARNAPAPPRAILVHEASAARRAERMRSWKRTRCGEV